MPGTVIISTLFVFHQSHKGRHYPHLKYKDNTTLQINYTPIQIFLKRGTSLAVQWLRLHASTAGVTGSIPGQGTKIPQAVQKTKKRKEIQGNQGLQRFKYLDLHLVKGTCLVTGCTII